MLHTTPVKKHLIQIRLTIAIILAYMTLFSVHQPEHPVWNWSYLLLYGLSNLALVNIPSKKFYRQNFFSVLACFDIVVLALVFYFNVSTDTQFFLLYFLVIALAAMSLNLKYLAATTCLFLGVYAWLLYQKGFFSGPQATVYALQLPFLFSVSLLFGFILHAATFDIRLILKKSWNALHSSMAPIVFTDVDGRISYVNQAFLRVFGYTRAREVENKPSSEFLFAKDLQEIFTELADRQSLFEVKSGDEFNWSYISPSTRRLLGYAAEETIPSLWELIASDSRADFQAFFCRAQGSRAFGPE